MQQTKNDFPIDYVNSLMKLTKEQALEYLNARGFKVRETDKFYFVSRSDSNIIDNRDYAVFHAIGFSTQCCRHGINSFNLRIPK